MFQRFYEAMPDEIDTLAEKMVGSYGGDIVDPFDQMFRSLEWLKSWEKISCPYHKSLQAEETLQESIRIVYEGLKSLDQLPLGLDDFLMALASDHEPNTYLLQQRTKGISKKAFLTSLEKSWSGDKTTDPIRRGVDEEPFDIEEDHAGSGPAEDYFRPTPLHKEVRQLQESGAITNLPDIAERATWTGRPSEEEVARSRKAPPSVKRILREDPYQREFSTLGRYVVDTSQPIGKRARLRRVTAKKVESKFIPGIVYEYTNTKFVVTHEPSGLVIISYNDGTKIQDPEKFVILADRVLRDMNWGAENFVIEKEKSRELTRQYQRHIELVPDETGELFYRVADEAGEGEL
jgi:hypothetical protein